MISKRSKCIQASNAECSHSSFQIPRKSDTTVGNNDSLITEMTRNYLLADLIIHEKKNCRIVVPNGVEFAIKR
jgi:hypothetical protein